MWKCSNIATETQKKEKQESFCYNRLSLRHILGVFTLLSVFVVYNLVTSSSRLPHLFDVTMKIKANVFDASIDNFVTDFKKWLSRNSSNSNVTFGTTKHPAQIGLDGIKVGDVNGTRPDNCTGCFEHNFKYIIYNENICKPVSTDQVIRLVIFITTIHKSSPKRDAIRQTWLTHTKNNTGDVRYAFLFGTIHDANLQEALVKENDIHHDIIQEDFADAYTNLTFKTVMAFKYATVRCAHAHYVMKTDDDMFVNIANLLRVTDKYSDALHKGIGGSCALQAAPIRDRGSKWFASVKSYPNRNYPGFCSGTGYVTSLDVARKIYKISPSIPFFHLEDVYTAICIRKLGLKLTKINGFSIGHPKLEPCNFKNDVLVTAHQLTPDNLRHVWNTPCKKG